jgi:hypothetical protein
MNLKRGPVEMIKMDKMKSDNGIGNFRGAF